ncbi:ABC transporter substrate-binding protein [Mobilicoccus massiliensis]|uniref:ABC transporter substrate-binding protein n=1 Tax=Mobilicoccus massiliensis TaxID=1522310 RepID=UPI00058F7BC0|nr:ABC transporter substrate-binding protein [Mobilicoccus massiliensis]
MRSAVSPRRLTIAIAPAVAALLAGCAGAPTGGQGPAAPSSAGSATPVTMTNCGEQVTVAQPPEKLVTLNQAATETALALGLADRMVGTAYLDDAVPAEYENAYDSVTVLAKEYPSKEQFLAAGPDFAYAAFASAFTDKAVGTRAELGQEGIGSYVSPFGCAKGTKPAEATFENGWKEITEIATIFDVPDNAKKLVDTQKQQVADVKAAGAGKGMTILWYDSGDRTPLVGAGGGGPQLIIDAVGGTNVFVGLDGGWSDGSWEKVVAANPDVIVLADASWDSADKKKKYLASDPTLSKLDAVKNERFVVVPFSESTPGVRLVDGAESVGRQIAALPAS